jgi:hypothetical protein
MLSIDWLPVPFEVDWLDQSRRESLIPVACIVIGNCYIRWGKTITATNLTSTQPRNSSPFDLGLQEEGIE